MINDNLVNWAGVLVESDEVSTIKEICGEYLLRISNCESSLSNRDISLAEGAGGIILLLIEMREVLGMDTDELIFTYIKYIEYEISKYRKNLSLYTGITGFAYAIHFENCVSGQYKKLLSSLDDCIAKQYKVYSRALSELGHKILTYHDYDVISGVSGISRYIVARSKQSSQMQELLCEITNDICKICKSKFIENEEIRGYASRRIDYENLNVTNEYEYNLGMAHGIPGILSALSNICLWGYKTPELVNTIKGIVNFFEELHLEIGDELWPNTKSINYITQNKQSRCAWCYGSPGVAASLFLAADALKCSNTRNIAEKIYNNMYEYEWNEWYATTPMICHGYSGLLAILLRFDKSDLLLARSSFLIDKIMQCFDLNKQYCFINNDFIKNRDNSSFLEGSTGIVLMLISILKKKKPMWDEVLLIS